MRTAIVINVTQERQLEIPPEFQDKLHVGDEYGVWISENMVMCKKIYQPSDLDKSMHRIKQEREIVVRTKGKLELTPGMQAQLNPNDEYVVEMEENAIYFYKVYKPIDLDEWFRSIEELGPDPDRPTLEEISETIKEMRREWKSKK